MAKKSNGISVCMIVKNEESVLDKCLESISALYDELIILDTGSTDSTISIAKKYTNLIYQTKWENNFSLARNQVQKYANFNYTLSWDADFILKTKDTTSLRKYLLKSLNKFDIFFFMWNAEIVNNIVTKKTFRPLLYKSDLFTWEHPIHEVLTSHTKSKKGIKEKYLPEVEVDHLKDPLLKSNRYSQTKNMLADYLKDNPDDLRMLIFYQSTFVFQKEYYKALEVFDKIFTNQKFESLDKDDQLIIQEQYLFTLLMLKKINQLNLEIKKFKSDNNRIMLFKADYFFLNKEYKQALDIYEYCINNPIQNSHQVGMIDIERHYIHPILMKAKILDLSNKKYDAVRLLKSIIHKTHRQDIKIYYENLKSIT